MYWGQITLAFSIAAGSAYVLWTRDRTLLTVALTGVATYILVRWMLAWLARVRYWYSNDGAHSRSCPECGQYIYRLQGDWILTCHRCGWTAGWPSVRWVTHSLPIVQLRRTVVGPNLLIFAIALVLILSGASAQFTADSVTLPNSDDESEEPVASPTVTADSDTSVQQGYDLSQVESEFIALLNEERADRGLQELHQRDVLPDMGEEHSANMAEHDYVGHVWPDGTTIEDRYRARGLLPECRLPIEGSNEYYPGTENAGQT